MVVQLKKTRVAVVGSSIAGLSTVYSVWKQVGYKCQIELFEPSTQVRVLCVLYIQICREYSSFSGISVKLYTCK